MQESFILGVDLDGVCGDYTTAFREVVAADRGVEPASLGEQRTWEFREWGLGRDEFERLHRAAVLEHRIFRTMPAMPGVAESLWRLSDSGIWIRIITHRLAVNWGHAVAVSDTVAWLDAVGIPYRDICFLGAKPQVEADLYVDDAAHNVLALRDRGNHVAIFDAPHNRHVEGPRVASWDEMEALTLDAAAGAGHPIQPQLEGITDASAPHDRLDARRSTPGARGCARMRADTSEGEPNRCAPPS